VLRVLAGVLIGVPLGWLLADVRRGWEAGSVAPDAPPFAPELADVPRQPGEPPWLVR
jgi:hypothetical protein